MGFPRYDTIEACHRLRSLSQGVCGISGGFREDSPLADGQPRRFQSEILSSRLE